MALLEMHYYSHALRMGVSVNVILPEGARAEDRPYRTLYLYHGYSDDHTTWQRHSAIEQYAEAYGIAVVMPNAGKSFYTDTAYGEAYFTFVTDELPRVCRQFFKGMSDRREDTFVAGNSMGGYGAVLAALSCPERFGGCASLSGALDLVELFQTVLPEEWRMIFGPHLTDSTQLAGTKHDLFALARQLQDADVTPPKLYLWCGETDSLVGSNRRFCALLDQLHIPYRYDETEGEHNFTYWDRQIRVALDYLLAQ